MKNNTISTQRGIKLNIPDLIEKKKHGTDGFPVAFYDSCRSIPHQWHKEDEFIYMVSGETEYNINGKRILLKTGDCAFCGRHKLHSMITGKNQHIHFKALLCDREYLFSTDDICRKYFHKDIKMTYSSSVPSENEIIDLVKKICVFAETQPFGYELTVKNLLLKIYSLIVQNDFFEVETENMSVTQKSLLSAIEYIHMNYSEKIYVDNLAKSTGYSTPYFEKFFKIYMGMSPSEYIMLYRLNISERLLRDTNMSIIEISHACGFPNVSYFIRKFKQDYFTTPYKYRQKKVLTSQLY